MKRGFTILEVMFAIFVILVGVLGAYTVIQKVISYTYQSSLRFTSAYLAQEGVEIVRNIRDANWVQGEVWNNDLTGVGTENWEADYTTSSFKGSGVGEDCSDFPHYNCNSFVSTDYLKIFHDFYCYHGSYKTPFTRKITITPNGERLTVSVSVWWNYKGNNKGPITVQEVLYRWYQ